MPSKIEREVKEILDNLDYFLPSDELDKPSGKGSSPGNPLNWLQRRFSVGQLVLGGLLITITTFFSLIIAPAVPVFVGIPGLVLLLTAIVLLLRPGPGRSQEPAWSGHDFGQSPEMGQTLWNRMRRRMKGHV